MNFILLLFVSSVLSVFVPFFLMRNLTLRWHIPRKVFWRSGFFGLIVGILVAGVALNLDGVFPAVKNVSQLLYAAIIGVTSGLFVELGKFVVLDRFMPKVRHFQSAVVFGLGWGGLAVMLMGIFFSIGIFGMNALLNVGDVSSLMSNPEPGQVRMFQESKKQLEALVQTPWKGLSPLFENSAIILFDIAMTLIILLGFQKSKTAYTWLAVLIRSTMATGVLFVAQQKTFPMEILYMLWAAVALGIIFTLKDRLKSGPVVK